MIAKKHILILSSWYPSPEKPYLGNYIRQFAEILSETNIVTVLVLEKNDSKSGETVLERISDSFHEIRSYYGESFLNKSKLKAHRKSLKFVKFYFPAIQIVHAHVGLTNWWHFLHFKKVLKLPMVYTEHGSYYFENNFRQLSLIQKIGLKNLMHLADEVTAVSEILKQEMERHYPKFTNVVGNILPKSWQQIPLVQNEKDCYDFLHVSTVDEIKNTAGIVEAVLLLVKKGCSNFRLTILSDENTVELQAFVQNNNLTNFIRFLGPHDHSAMPEVYQTHDCFVLNSTQETFSIVLAEALFFGLHVISTKVGFLANEEKAPFEEIVGNNSTDLAKKMEKALNEKKRSGEIGRSFVKQFSEDEILKKYSLLYQKLIK